MRLFMALPLLAVAGTSPLLAAEYRYSKIDVPGSIHTEANGINARGDIVGIYVDPEGTSHSYLLRQGTFTTIEVPGATETLAARAINARGDIVGNFHDAQFVRHGYLLSDGHFTRIDYPGAFTTIVGGINNAGDITGQAEDAQGNVTTFILKNGHFSDVRVPGSSLTQVRAAQDNGRTLVGSVVMRFDGGTRGFVITQPGNVELIEYPGLAVPCSGVRYMSEGGDMVGAFAVIDAVDICYPPFAEQHGFLLRNGEFTLVDFPQAPETDAFSINSDGVIVGRFTDAKGATHGFRAVPTD